MTIQTPFFTEGARLSEDSGHRAGTQTARTHRHPQRAASGSSVQAEPRWAGLRADVGRQDPCGSWLPGAGAAGARGGAGRAQGRARGEAAAGGWCCPRRKMEAARAGPGAGPRMNGRRRRRGWAPWLPQPPGPLARPREPRCPASRPRPRHVPSAAAPAAAAAAPAPPAAAAATSAAAPGPPAATAAAAAGSPVSAAKRGRGSRAWSAGQSGAGGAGPGECAGPSPAESARAALGAGQGSGRPFLLAPGEACEGRRVPQKPARAARQGQVSRTLFGEKRADLPALSAASSQDPLPADVRRL